MKISLNRNQIKYIVALAMVIDHIAWAFVPLESPLGFAMHSIGRLTGPVMAYFIAEGYLHTRDVKKYAIRLGVFSLISWPAYSLFEAGKLFSFNFSVITTLFLGLMAILVQEKTNLSETMKLVSIAGIAFLSYPCDWAFYGVLLPWMIVNERGNEKKQWNGFLILTVFYIILAVSAQGAAHLFNVGMILPYLLLRFCYNGRKGSDAPFHKWFFYVFYPLQFVLLVVIRMVIY